MQSKLIILKQSFPVCDFSTAKVEGLFNIRKFIQRIARFYKQNPDEPEIPEYPGNSGQSGIPGNSGQSGTSGNSGLSGITYAAWLF